MVNFKIHLYNIMVLHKQNQESVPNHNNIQA